LRIAPQTVRRRCERSGQHAAWRRLPDSMNRLSLSSRIALLLGLSAVILLGGAALIMDQLVDAEVGRRMDTALLTQAQTLASLIDTSPRGLDLEDVRKPRPQWLSHRAVEYWSV